MSDRKRASEKGDRRDHKRHKTSKHDVEKLKTQTKKLRQEVQKIKHIETLWVSAVRASLFALANLCMNYQCGLTQLEVVHLACLFHLPLSVTHLLWLLPAVAGKSRRFQIVTCAGAWEFNLQHLSYVCLICFMQLWETSTRTYKGNTATNTKYSYTYCGLSIFTHSAYLHVQKWWQGPAAVFRSTRKNQRTVFLLNQEMKKPGTSWHMPPLRGCGCPWGRRWRWCSVSIVTLIRLCTPGFSLRERNMLLTGVPAMTQSLIEFITTLWDIPHSHRCEDWMSGWSSSPALY